VSEWLKEHAWKVCIPQKGIEGSNPSLSADSNIKIYKEPVNVPLTGFFVFKSSKRAFYRVVLHAKGLEHENERIKGSDIKMCS
jgi:hypothetical protein